jgi:hypothetical protein
MEKPSYKQEQKNLVYQMNKVLYLIIDLTKFSGTFRLRVRKPPFKARKTCPPEEKNLKSGFNCNS